MTATFQGYVSKAQYGNSKQLTIFIRIEVITMQIAYYDKDNRSVVHRYTTLSSKINSAETINMNSLQNASQTLICHNNYIHLLHINTN